MTLKEMFICAKTRDQSANEDGLVMTDELVAVIDGATSKTGLLYDGKKPGLCARETLEEQFYCSTIRGRTPEQYFTELDRALARFIRRTDPDMPDSDRPRASVVLYNGLTKEIWSYGDCQYLINGAHHQFDKKIDTLNGDVRSFVIKEALQRGLTVEEIKQQDIGRDRIMPLLCMQAAFENRTSEWGYPVLNGKGINPELIEVHKVNEGDIIVLASDGYPVLEDTLEKSEEKLHELLEKDPLCIDELRTTKCPGEDALSFDDRTYVRIGV